MLMEIEPFCKLSLPCVSWNQTTFACFLTTLELLEETIGLKKHICKQLS